MSGKTLQPWGLTNPESGIFWTSGRRILYSVTSNCNVPLLKAHSVSIRIPEETRRNFGNRIIYFNKH